jgi:ribonuclease HI
MNEQSNISLFTGQRHYLIATDGSCNPNPGTGGWGVVIQLVDNGHAVRQRALAGQGEVMISTNNKMELTAAVQGLQGLTEPLPVIVISDSEYVVKSATERLENWKAAGWKNKEGPVKNRELWEQLDQACFGRTVKWVWQRGHVGHDLNEIADQLASNAGKGMYPNLRSVKRLHPTWFW